MCGEISRKGAKAQREKEIELTLTSSEIMLCAFAPLREICCSSAGQG
jgi:hypothetical protein